MTNFEDQGPIVDSGTTRSAVDTNGVLTKVFFRMFLGLLATAIAASYTYYSGLLDDFVNEGGYLFCLIGEIVVALVFSFGFRKLPAGVVTVLFYTYAVLTGVTFSTIFIAFELTSIAYAFIATAGVFGIMALIGKNTKADLSKLGTILTVSLLACVLVSIVNIFVGSSGLDIALDCVIILIFMGFTAYDINKIMSLGEFGMDEKFYIYGAMELYLDFINLFLRILSIFGKRRD